MERINEIYNVPKPFTGKRGKYVMKKKDRKPVTYRGEYTPERFEKMVATKRERGTLKPSKPRTPGAGRPNKKVYLYSWRTGEFLKEFESVVSTAKHFKVDPATIRNHIDLGNSNKIQNRLSYIDERKQTQPSKAEWAKDFNNLPSEL